MWAAQKQWFACLNDMASLLLAGKCRFQGVLFELY
jgi:hypothetical protein